MNFKNTLAVAATLALLAGCGPPSATQIESQKQEASTLQAVQAVGMPSITNFQEKRILKNILELRDTKVRTYTYTQDLNAGLHKLCDSVGYGIPYSTQYTNPQFVDRGSSAGYAILPQADPNGLYSPSSADGTWVLCVNPEKPDDLAPVFVEPRIIVSTFPLKAVD